MNIHEPNPGCFKSVSVCEGLLNILSPGSVHLFGILRGSDSTTLLRSRKCKTTMRHCSFSSLGGFSPHCLAMVSRERGSNVESKGADNRDNSCKATVDVANKSDKLCGNTL